MWFVVGWFMLCRFGFSCSVCSLCVLAYFGFDRTWTWRLLGWFGCFLLKSLVICCWLVYAVLIWFSMFRVHVDSFLPYLVGAICSWPIMVDLVIPLRFFYNFVYDLRFHVVRFSGSDWFMCLTCIALLILGWYVAFDFGFVGWGRTIAMM